MDNLLLRLELMDIQNEYEKFLEERDVADKARDALSVMEANLAETAETLFYNIIGKLAVTHSSVPKVKLIVLYRTFNPYAGVILAEDKLAVEEILEAYGIK